MRVGVLDFLDTDVFNITPESCAAFLDPLIVSWDIDLASFGLEIVLNRRIAPAHLKKFEFVERESAEASDGEPGLQEFLKDRSFNGDATLEEVEFLKQLRFKNRRRPTALFYYRELQNLRDPLHFRDAIERGPGGGEAPTLPENATRPEPSVVSRGGRFDQASGPSSNES